MLETKPLVRNHLPILLNFLIIVNFETQYTNALLKLAADDVSKLLKEVGVAPEKEALDNLIKAVKGKKLHDLVKEGSKKLASVPSGKLDNK